MAMADTDFCSVRIRMTIPVNERDTLNTRSTRVSRSTRTIESELSEVPAPGSRKRTTSSMYHGAIAIRSITLSGVSTKSFLDGMSLCLSPARAPSAAAERSRGPAGQRWRRQRLGSGQTAASRLSGG